MVDASNASTATGHDAERRAEAFLNQHGLRTLARNHRCRRGELDLVMSADGGEHATVVFVEVRQRQCSHDAALNSIDRHKQQRLICAAQDFLRCHPHCAEHACRFDVIALSSSDQAPHWIPAAFEADV